MTKDSPARTELRDFAALMALGLLGMIVVAIFGYIDSPEALSIVFDLLF